MIKMDMSTETPGVKAEFEYHTHINTRSKGHAPAPEGVEICTEIELYWSSYYLGLMYVTYATWFMTYVTYGRWLLLLKYCCFLCLRGLFCRDK